MGGIAERLQASLRHDALHGTLFERGIVEKQIHEAITTIKSLQEENARLHKLIDRLEAEKARG